MAIDQYRPELAKRRASFDIAYTQLLDAISNINEILFEDVHETKIDLEAIKEAAKDFLETAATTAEWLNVKVEEAQTNE